MVCSIYSDIKKPKTSQFKLMFRCRIMYEMINLISISYFLSLLNCIGSGTYLCINTKKKNLIQKNLILVSKALVCVTGKTKFTDLFLNSKKLLGYKSYKVCKLIQNKNYEALFKSK